jgi:hypothetical protein
MLGWLERAKVTRRLVSSKYVQIASGMDAIWNSRRNGSILTSTFKEKHLLCSLRLVKIIAYSLNILDYVPSTLLSFVLFMGQGMNTCVTQPMYPFMPVALVLW